MKKKIFSILFALVLVASFSLVTAVPVAAQAPIGDPFFTTNELGTAEWSTEPKTAGDYSAKLYIPPYDPGRKYDEARVVFSYDGDLNSITGVSYPSYVIGGNNGDLYPMVVLAVDSTGDKAVDSWVCQWGPYDHTPLENAWETISFDGSSPVHVAGARTGLPEDHYLPYSNPNLDTDTLDLLQAEGGWGAFKVLEVKVFMGEFTNLTQDMTAYVDDVTINGVLYELEPRVINTTQTKGYNTIQAAIDAAQPNDTINVAAGTYNERVNLNKSLTLEGANVGTPGSGTRGPESIINPQGLGLDFGVLIDGADTIATIDGFTVENYERAGILAGAFSLENDPAVVNILNNIVTEPIGEHNNNCIQVGDGTTGTVIGNEVMGANLDSPDWSGSGILVSGSSDVLVSYNYVHDCEGGIQIIGYEVYKTVELGHMHPAEDNVVEYNLVEGNKWGISVQTNSIGTIIRYNDVLNNNTTGIGSIGNISWEPTIPSGTQIHYNNIVGNADYGVKSSVWDESLGGPEQVDATNNWWDSANGPEHAGNTFNVGVQGDKVSDYVDYVPWHDTDMAGTSFAPVTNEDTGDKFSSIQGAIDDANTDADDTINVAAGEYEENLNIPAGMGNLKLLGHSKDDTVLKVSDGVGIKVYCPAIIKGFHILREGSGGDAIEVRGQPANAADGTEAKPGVIQNNKMEGFETSSCGVEFVSYPVKYWVINGNEFVDCRLAVYLNENANYIEISGNTFSNYNEGIGMDWDGVNHHLTITGNRFLGTDDPESKAAILVGSVDHDITITNNVIVLPGSGASNRGVWIKHTVADNLVNLTNVHINYNNFSGNTVYGIQNDAPKDVDATKNWWDDPSGPDGDQGFGPEETYTGLLPGSGNKVSANVRCMPWLTKPFKTVLEDAIAYFGVSFPAQKGWNIVSAPLALDENVTVTVDGVEYKANTWGGLLNLGKIAGGDDYALKLHYTEDAEGKRTYPPIYYYVSDPESDDFGWQWANEFTEINPVDAFYIRMMAPDSFPVLFSPDLSVPSKKLYQGWNLVGCAYMDVMFAGEDGQPLKTALATIAEVSSLAGDVTGYSQVVSPPVNQVAWIYIPTPEGPGIYIPEESEGVILMGKGYWVFMENPGTLAGLTFTPISLGPK